VPRFSSSSGACLLAGLIALAITCASAVAQDQKKPDTTAADADLLEFLGSVDSGGDSQTAADDGSWIEYLAQTDIGKVAKATSPSDPPKQPPTGDKPPAPERVKNE
jgi:hypothetical protein